MELIAHPFALPAREWCGQRALTSVTVVHGKEGRLLALVLIAEREDVSVSILHGCQKR